MSDNVFLLNQGDDSRQRSELFLATVTAVSSSGVRFRLDGQSSPTEKNYKQLNTGKTLNVDDRVVVMKQSGTYIVLGRISYENSGGGGGGGGDAPDPSTTTPKMDGTANVGSETAYSRGDHVHPTDTSRAAATETVSDVTYNSSTKKLQKTINGTTTDVAPIYNYSLSDYGIGMCYCKTAQNTTAKTAGWTDYFKRAGQIFFIWFRYAVPAGSTLSINSKAAENICIAVPGSYDGTARGEYRQIADGDILAGDGCLMQYDGYNYVVMGILRNMLGYDILGASSAISIPASGSSISKNMTGLTSGHQLVRWGFSSSPENRPPADLSWQSYDGYFTVTNNGGTTSETIKPVFALPVSAAISNH